MVLESEREGDRERESVRDPKTNDAMGADNTSQFKLCKSSSQKHVVVTHISFLQEHQTRNKHDRLKDFIHEISQ